MRCGVEKQRRAATRGPALDARALPRFTPLSQRPALFRLFQALPSDRASYRAEPRLPRRRLAAADVTAKPPRAAAPHTKKMGRTTAADKKKMLLKIYHTKKEPFNLKELTKLAKAAGLAEKLVQDVNTQLMDDNYVSSDKIGTGNYFWAFPGSQGAQAKKQLDEARANLKRAQDRLAKAKVAEQEAKSGREDTDGSRAANLKKLADLKTRRVQLEQRLEAYKANDPEELARIEKLSEDMKQHAIRWTENLFSVKDYLVQKKGVASYQIDELFKSVGLPKNLDIE